MEKIFCQMCGQTAPGHKPECPVITGEAVRWMIIQGDDEAEEQRELQAELQGLRQEIRLLRAELEVARVRLEKVKS